MISFAVSNAISIPFPASNSEVSASAYGRIVSNRRNSDSIVSPLAVWTSSDIADAVGGRIVRWGRPGAVCADTRNLQPGQWFFAISGENFDGHDFVNAELCEKGCVGVIGNRVCPDWDRGYVQMNGDSVALLKRMGSYARGRFDGSVVGITGSVGKTTTKAMVALILESFHGTVYQSPGNWNNEIGVALSLIGIPRNAGIVVLEMGMSAKGEIFELARMAMPSIRVVLNAGASHLENFCSLEEVASAKGEIFEEARQGDACVLNADDPLVSVLQTPGGVRKVMFGRKRGCDLRLVAAEGTAGGLGVKVVLENFDEMVEFVIPSPGQHLALNACAAAAVVSLLGVPFSQVGSSLSKFTPIEQRSELEVMENGMRIINDVYNANPMSTKAAIDLLKGIECDGKRVAILGDMLELGEDEIEFHETMLGYCFDCCIDLVGLVGDRYVNTARSRSGPWWKNSNIICALDAESLAVEIVNMLRANDVVLVKGSHGMKMEKVVEAIRAKANIN